jgi:hypothetical protein
MLGAAMFAIETRDPARSAASEGHMLVSLVLVFCMADSSACTEARPVTEDLSPMACMVRGQQVAQEWLAEHPGWQLSRVRCEGQSQRESERG